MCITKECEDPTAEGVWWRDDAEWKQYNAAQAATIRKAITDGTTRVQLGIVVSPKHNHGASYEVDLSTMTQINPATRFVREVKVVNAPTTAVMTSPPGNVAEDIASVKEEVRACHETIRSLKEMVQKMEAAFTAVTLPAAKSDAPLASGNQVAAVLKSQHLDLSRGYADDMTEYGDDVGEYLLDDVGDYSSDDGYLSLDYGY